MTEKNPDDTAPPPQSNIEEILKERERLEKVLKEEYRKEVTILFSDICGYTQYIDTRGDISGRSLLLKHNNILLPIIEENNGKVVELIGDAVMASFPDTQTAVRVAIAIQEALASYNTETDPADRIHVKIGINVGEALVDEGAVFQSITGDVANVASRIQSQAGKDEILISGAVYDDVCGNDELLCRFHGAAQVKGKAEPQKIYKVVWSDEEVVLEAEPKVRLYHPGSEKKEIQTLNVINLEVTLEGDLIKISAHEHTIGESTTIRHYEKIPISLNAIDTRCHELVNTLNKANRRGRLTREILTTLREIGQIFHDELFTTEIKDKLENSKAEFLRLYLDDQLVHIPWELLYDGRQFLCQRFNMGRLVKTRQAPIGIRSRALARPLKLLILADPGGDLNGAYDEGTQLRDQMDQDKEFLNVSLRSDKITVDSIKRKVRNFDIIHFAGHADYSSENPDDSGWRLSDGTLKTSDITKMAGTATMPSLIFSNACQSARTDWALAEHFENEIFGLANAFLLGGVNHYIGTFWEILDEPSSRFALEFYKCIFADMPVGEAMRQARLALIREYGEETIIWASYLLYGDPTFNYMDHIKDQTDDPMPEPVPVADAIAGGRTREEVIDFGEEENVKKGRPWRSVVAGVVILAAVLLWAYPGLLINKGSGIEQEALAYFNTSNYPGAIETCNVIKQKDPDNSLCNVILGKIHLQQGDLKSAKLDFQQALGADKGSDTEKAEALIGLGRISSIANRTGQAMSHYQEASNLAPDNPRAHVARGVMLNREGKYNEALEALGKAAALAPDDRSIGAIANETREKIAYTKDKEKQARVDTLVRDLLDNMDEIPAPAPSDGWTAMPLTLWMMDFKTQGYGLQEGEETLIASGIMDHMIGKTRVRVVERALLDKLLAELKLGSTKLVDQSTAASLGRLVAARVILSGRVVHSGSQTQVSMRLIETETGEVKAAVNEIFASSESTSNIAEKLSVGLAEKFNTLYPLRGKITDLKEKEISLNIGRNQGVKIGRQFKVVDTDWVLEASAVRPDSSAARIKNGEVMLKKGLRVEAM